MHLNLYLSRAGIASRRKAAEMIKRGFISVNGNTEQNPGYKVQPGDKVRCGEQIVRQPREYIYVVLNKPKGYLSTTSDDQGRKNVLDLVAQATKQRLYPVGRLDKDTTGLLLLTNDGDFAHKLAHPRFEVSKTYEVVVEDDLPPENIKKIADGIYLSDGFIKPDYVGYVGKSNRRIKITLHSGRNRIIRRIIEQIGHNVKELIRTKFANLTIKSVPVGAWRLLSDQEIDSLKAHIPSVQKNKQLIK